jgi:LmbE family N-acetylglucosaminyl deacetylase
MKIVERQDTFFARGLLLMLVLGVASAALAQSEGVPPAKSLAEQMRRLHTTARILHIVAHPDDEDGGMLTMEARGKGATVMLLTLNRGEGGQNETGPELFDELGVLRTLELLAADRDYGVEQRFTRAADFGFSKSADETFQKWGGHDVVLADVVRVVREFQPDVIISRFQGNSEDGHGNHQAAGILAQEAFRAAADPNRFPEQLREGLQPWQAKKLYIGNIHPDRGEAYTIKLDEGENDPVLGGSYAEIAMHGLRHQLSQGAGEWRLSGERVYRYYRLVDTTIPNYKPEREQDFLDGIDTTITGLDKIAPTSLQPRIDGRLQQLSRQIDVAGEAKDESESVTALAEASTQLEKIRGEPSSTTAGGLGSKLESKREQLEAALNLAAGAKISATYDTGQRLAEPPVAIRGESVPVAVSVTNNGSETIRPTHIVVTVKGKTTKPPKRFIKKPIAPGQTATVALMDLPIPGNAKYTEPCFHRDNPQRDGLYQVDRPGCATLPLPPSPFHITVTYKVLGHENDLSTDVIATYYRAKGMQAEARLIIAPNLSVLMTPEAHVFQLSPGEKKSTAVTVKNEAPAEAEARVRVNAADKNTVSPTSPAQPVTLKDPEEKKSLSFAIRLTAAKDSETAVTATARSKRENFSEAFEAIGRPDIGTAFYFHPAVQRISVVDVKLPRNLKVGYIMGAGDDIPPVLRDIGMDVTMIPSASLATANLGAYGTIVLGIRTYGTQPEVRANNAKLLDYVQRGGTLVAQYDSAVADFNEGHFTPYPAELGRGRVSVEEAPVDILQPQDGIFHFPNEITQKDFEGWVQERGLYFMSTWDDKFQPLLASHDPGEPPLKGGLLVAHYGKGTYIYTGYSFFRELPSGVPGAVRLFVNLLSAGHVPEK